MEQRSGGATRPKCRSSIPKREVRIWKWMSNFGRQEAGVPTHVGDFHFHLRIVFRERKRGQSHFAKAERERKLGNSVKYCPHQLRLENAFHLNSETKWLLRCVCSALIWDYRPLCTKRRDNALKAQNPMDTPMIFQGCVELVCWHRGSSNIRTTSNFCTFKGHLISKHSPISNLLEASFAPKWDTDFIDIE